MQRSTVPIGLSTSSVFPGTVEDTFALASAIGYDGVEIMVTAERISQDAKAIASLVEQYSVPVLAVHSPCLLVTARIWGTDPAEKVRRSVEMAVNLGANTVVAHPPFLWQRTTDPAFEDVVADLSASQPVRVAIENMFPVKVLRTIVNTYRPYWNPLLADYPWYTLDLSHAMASHSDAHQMMDAMGPRLAHLHLADGSGAMRDEHLLPGHGAAPCDTVLHRLARAGFDGAVVIEVGTQRLAADARREALTEALAFARAHLGASPESP